MPAGAESVKRVVPTVDSCFHEYAEAIAEAIIETFS